MNYITLKKIFNMETKDSDGTRIRNFNNIDNQMRSIRLKICDYKN